MAPRERVADGGAVERLAKGRDLVRRQQRREPLAPGRDVPAGNSEKDAHNRGAPSPLHHPPDGPPPPLREGGRYGGFILPHEMGEGDRPKGGGGGAASA